jgi:hypothetical protein
LLRNQSMSSFKKCTCEVVIEYHWRISIGRSICPSYVGQSFSSVGDSNANLLKQI